MARTPSPADVAALSRDDWEKLCRSLAAIIYDAQGVEDHHGKGNGLDSIRIDLDGARGWQFRRYDDRFEYKQAASLLESVRLAAARCETEDKVKLVEFSLWANLDLEPGHMKSEGERERFKKVADTVKNELGVTLKFVGLTWVHAQLLLRSSLRPDLFEDVAGQVSAVQRQLTGMTDQLAQLKEMVTNAASATQPVRRLVEEAMVHYKRGYAMGSSEFQAASRCFRDAWNLLRELKADLVLEGRVLIALAGTEHMLGNLKEAVEVARTALTVLPPDEGDAIALARGTLALALQDLQSFAECESLFEQAFAHFESTANPVELVRSLTHLLEFEINQNNLDVANPLGKRLKHVVIALEDLMGISDLSMAAAGALARLTLENGKVLGSAKHVRAASTTFADIEVTAREISAPQLVVAAVRGQAEAAHFLKQHDAAIKLWRRAIDDAGRAHMAKAVADSFFMLAIVQHERGLIADALESITEAKKRYEAIGDAASAADAVSLMTRWVQ